jgi:protein-disulfide isomerase
VIRIALVLMLVACASTDELEKKITKLEDDVATLRKERQFLEVKQVQLLKEVGELSKKLDEVMKAATPPPYRPTARRQPDAATTYSLAIDPADPADGPADALVTVVELYEYACPFCEKVRPTLHELKKRYGSELRWVGKQLVVHPQTATAAALAICAANKQRKFSAMDRLLWEDGFKARLFDRSGCWDEIDGCPIVLGFARRIGLDTRRFREDMKESCMTWLRGNEGALKKLGGAATPTFFINGRYLSGAQPVDSFAALIDEELAKAKARVQQGSPRSGYYEKWVVEEGQLELDP